MSDDDLRSLEAILPVWGIAVEDGRKPALKVLGGGVSNLVVRVEAGDKGTFVVKQSLPKLRVDEDWFADRERIVKEAACLRVIAKYVGQEFSPKVLGEDPMHFALLLECAPEGTVTWKKELLEGKIDPDVTGRVAYFLSEFHLKTMENEADLRVEFSDQSNFIQLRINPYLVRIIGRHPDLKQQLDEIISGLITTKLCLVHGDFSPKNILLLPDGKVWIIDCEVAHLGNPAFDVAFCTNHLVLKAIHLSSFRQLNEAKRFWKKYWFDSQWSQQENFTTKVLAALMLARVDGKSPVEYLSEENRKLVRDLSRNLIANRVSNFEELTHVVEEKIREKTA